jgi:phosphotriesterase-related protein
MVNSVLGNIEPKDLGFTLMHEHIISMNPSMAQAFPQWFNRQETISIAINQLQYTKLLGLNTIVDATPFNLGRDILMLEEVSKKTGVNIIASTGFYFVDEPFLRNWEPEYLRDLLLQEIESGIQGTSIKPGVIKCASEDAISETNEKLLRVAARAQKQSHLPIITHSSSVNKNGLHQQEILLDEDVDVSKLVIGHCGDTTDIDYLESLLGNGGFIGFDRFGLDILLPMESRLEVCAELLKKGYEDQIVLSHDYCVFFDWFPPEIMPMVMERGASRWSYHHIFEDIIPRLLEQGATENQIHMMTVENPRKIFS